MDRKVAHTPYHTYGQFFSSNPPELFGMCEESRSPTGNPSCAWGEYRNSLNQRLYSYRGKWATRAKFILFESQMWNNQCTEQAVKHSVHLLKFASRAFYGILVSECTYRLQTDGNCNMEIRLPSPNYWSTRTYNTVNCPGLGWCRAILYKHWWDDIENTSHPSGRFAFNLLSCHILLTGDREGFRPVIRAYKGEVWGCTVSPSSLFKH